MTTYALSRTSRLVSATSWGAIARGVFVALAIQTVLLLFGLAIAGTVGDHVAEAGYAFWMVIVFMLSFAIGGAVAAASADDKAGGIAAGFMTWAVALVVANGIGTLLAAPQRAETSPLWTSLIAAILALVAAVIGGLIGASEARKSDEDDLLDPHDVMTSPMR